MDVLSFSLLNIFYLTINRLYSVSARVQSDVTAVVSPLQLERLGVPQSPTSTLILTGQRHFRHLHLPRDRRPSCQRLRGTAAVPTVPPQRRGPRPCQAIVSPTEALWRTTSEVSDRDRRGSGYRTTSAAPRVQASRSTCPVLTMP